MNHVRNGFTMIELMLAMTFISMLMLAIAMTTIQVSHIYTKGITLREVNQAGRLVTEQMRRDIMNSPPFDIDQSAAATKYISLDGGGRLCMGHYSYAWNYGDALAGGAGAPLIVNEYDDQSNVRFAKVRDPSGLLCAEPSSTIQKSQATELLSSGDRELALQDFSISQLSDVSAPGQSLYTVKLTIGTNDQTQLETNNASCRPPAEGEGNEDYCSVNEFTIVAQAGNRSGGGE